MNMFVELGHFSLILAFCIAISQAFLPLYGFYRDDVALMGIAPRAALLQFLLVLVAYASLTHAYIVSDFSVLNVVQNSHSLKPLLYKWSGVWSNHEGSMLLWVLILTLFGAALAFFSKNIPLDMLSVTLSVQAMISLAFIAFVIFTSNPFLRVSNPPLDGMGLNPVLQDPGLAVHPPLLYLGYVGFSIVFSFAAAALFLGRVDVVFARMIRPWTLAAWITLTFGITLGAYWAYYELGWGGYWFWDPVENASLMPWLTGTALLHSAIVLEKRESLKAWTVLLAVVTFSFSLLGTFLVRSGVLTSVHSFASDPQRGLFILLILVLFIGGSFTLFALRAYQLGGSRLFSPISREGMLVFNNLFLFVAAFSVLVGTLYPLIIEAIAGDKISVGPPFFNKTVVPIMIFLFMFIPFAQRLAWKRGDFLGCFQRLWVSFAFGILAASIIAFLVSGSHILVLAAIALGFYLIFGAFDEILYRASTRDVSVFFKRLFLIPRTVYAMVIAHAGVGVLILGLAGSAFESESIVAIKPHEKISIGAYSLELSGMEERKGANYTAKLARFILWDGDKKLAELSPGKRLHIGRQMPTSEVARYRHGFSEIYVAIGDLREDGSLEVRAYDKTFVLLVFLGPLLMAIAGMLSLSDWRVRVGVPRPSSVFRGRA